MAKKNTAQRSPDKSGRSGVPRFEIPPQEKSAGDENRVSRFETIDIKSIVPNGENHRVIDVKSAEFRELVNSIAAGGIRIPLIVTPAVKEGKFQLRAGSRRLLAAAEAGLLMVPAIVCTGTDDASAEDITYIENKYRVDLTPLEEANEVEQLLEKHKGDIKAVASKLGRPVYHIRQLIAIKNKLSKKWLNIFKDNNDSLAAHLTVAHLQLIAVQPANIQEELFDKLWWFERNPSVADLEELFNENQMLLSTAPWDKEDKSLLAKAGACIKCAKRTGAQPGLFDDEEDAEVLAKRDRCLDFGCWKAKQKAFVEKRAKELRSQHKELVFAIMPDEVSGIDYQERDELAKAFGSVIGGWKKAQEGDKNAVLALIVRGAHAGELRYIKYVKNISPNKERGSGTSAAQKGEGKSLEEKRKLLERKRWSFVVAKMSELVAKAKVSQLVCDDPVITVMALTATFGTTFDYSKEQKSWKAFAELESQKQSEVLEVLFDSVCRTISDDLTYSGPLTQIGDDRIELAKAAARLIGVDIDKIFAEAQVEYPEPKSWKTKEAEK